jgi:glucan 1,3-beta-glucosidase
MLAISAAFTSGHIPPSPAELAHLDRLRSEHAKSAHARKLSTSKPDYSCPVSSGSEKATAEATWKVTGTSLGGWLVLEPWLTPSLFYQFLGADIRYGPDIEMIKQKTGMDQKSFCTALGPAEANRQLRRHWKAWVTEQHIADIAATGATHLRIPVGDWMFEPYDIYDVEEDGVRCNDGAREELERGLGLARKYGLKVLLDMHAWIGSQNGLDNSGETKFVKWASKFDSGTSGEMYAPKGTFEHWAFKGWDWIINSTADWGMAMELINRPHYEHSMRVLAKVAKAYANHPAVWGLEPVNEVGAWTPMDVLRKFYWEAYAVVRASAPHWIFLMDTSFRGGEVAADGFMKGCPNTALDKHPYHAWAPWGRIETYYKRSCGWADENTAIEKAVGLPVIAGEWSLAMDTCAMWLLGFNDMQPGEPRAICDMVPCPCAGASSTAPGTMDSCYLRADADGSGVQDGSGKDGSGKDNKGDLGQPGLPLETTTGLLGPFGSGISGPMFGRCPREMAVGEFEDEWMTTLTHKQVAAFNQGHGWFFWNFRTEFEPHWDFLEAWRRGWFPRNVSDFGGLEKLRVCDEKTPPLAPTVPKQTAPGPAPKEAKPWSYKILTSSLPIAAFSAIGGALCTILAMRLMNRGRVEAADDYVAMPGSRS